MKSCNRDCRNNYTICHQTLNILFSVVSLGSYFCVHIKNGKTRIMMWASEAIYLFNLIHELLSFYLLFLKSSWTSFYNGNLGLAGFLDF